MSDVMSTEIQEAKDILIDAIKTYRDNHNLNVDFSIGDEVYKRVLCTFHFPLFERKKEGTPLGIPDVVNIKPLIPLCYQFEDIGFSFSYSAGYLCETGNLRELCFQIRSEKLNKERAVELAEIIKTLN